MSYLRRTSTRRPAARRPAVAAVLAGCGSSSSSPSSGNGVESKSAAQILEATKTAASEATSVHIVGSIVSAGKPITLDMELLAGKGGKGKIGQEGFTIDLVQTGGSVYINGERRLLPPRRRRGSGAAAAGRWLKAPAEQRRTRLAGLADEPQQADRHGPGKPRHARQGLEDDDRRPAGDRHQRHHQGRHALRGNDRQGLPAGDRQGRQRKRAKSLLRRVEHSR